MLATTATSEYQFELLNEFTGPVFARLADLKYRALYRNLGQEAALFAIGASYHNEPIGAAIAEMYADTPPTILDLQVASAFQGAGVGLDLLTRMEKTVRDRGRNEIRIYYRSDSPSAPALERMLARRNWPAPQVAEYLFAADQRIVNAPWMTRYKLPPSFTVFPWTALTADERWLIEERQRLLKWVPWAVWPLDFEPLEPRTSLGLRHAGEVVGWVITRLTAPDTLAYEALFVSPEYEFLSRGVALLAEAIRRQYALGVHKGAWAVLADNAPMLKFVERRMAPYLTARAELRRSIKPLTGSGLAAAA